MVKTVMLSLEIKQEIVEKLERGVRVSELAKQYDRNMSTINNFEAKGSLSGSILCACSAVGCCVFLFCCIVQIGERNRGVWVR